MGISGALAGAHVLAGEISRRPDDLPAALAHYDTTLRPFVNEIQGEVDPRLLKLALPMTQRAIDAFLTVTGLATTLRVPDLVARLSKEDRGGDWRLPHYPELRAA